MIEADAFIYNNENKILHFITNELTAHDGFEGSREQNAYMKLTDYMKNFRIVVYIKNIEVFADEPRQVFLSSLLDNISTYSIKVCVVFSTNCLFFLNRLEKRVKSRFSYKNFIFEDFDLETHLVPILEARFHIQEYEREHGTIVAHVKSEKVIRFLSKYHQLGMSIGWFIGLFKTALLLFKSVDYISESRLVRGEDYFISKLQEAKKMLLFEGGDAEILNNMPRPAKLIMMGVSSIGLRWEIW